MGSQGKEVLQKLGENNVFNKEVTVWTNTVKRDDNFNGKINNFSSNQRFYWVIVYYAYAELDIALKCAELEFFLFDLEKYAELLTVRNFT